MVNFLKLDFQWSFYLNNLKKLMRYFKEYK